MSAAPAAGVAPLDLPPLLTARAVSGSAFAAAVAAAQAGADGGLVLHGADRDGLDLAIVLAPEVPLAGAMAMVPVAGNAMADAFGAHAPSEVAFHLEWPGTFRVNGARCGGIRAAASGSDPDAVPDWLVLGLALPMTGGGPAAAEPGHAPDATVLCEEGCGGMDMAALGGSWGRHFLTWLHEWQTDGMRRVVSQWRARAHGLRAEVTVAAPGGAAAGLFVGLDEQGGMLLRAGGGVRLLPLTMLLEEAP